jgi:glycosidase
MDLVPNHSSDQHMWFLKSVAKENPFTDYYVWAPAKGYEDGKPIPPNNWVSKTLGENRWAAAIYWHIVSFNSQTVVQFSNPAAASRR